MSHSILSIDITSIFSDVTTIRLDFETFEIQSSTFVAQTATIDTLAICQDSFSVTSTNRPAMPVICGTNTGEHSECFTSISFYKLKKTYPAMSKSVNCFFSLKFFLKI